ncbi:MAG: AMP-binding protein [Ardenticatenaceae bacterium]|nr:AMP-binding protein [Ardenticatenaceae bacterium]
MRRPFWNAGIETLAPEELRRLEDEALRRQLAYLATRSAFYARKFAEAGVDPATIRSRADLPRLPFTEKDELRANQETHPPLGNYLAAPREQIVRLHKTSGTTGRPLFVGLTSHDLEVTHEIGARAFWAAGLGPGDTVVHCLNYQLWIGGLTDHLSLERTGATVVPFGVGNSRDLVRTIQMLGINAISSTPSYLVHLITIVRDQLGLEPRELGLRQGFFGGEPGLQNPAYRARIEETWGMRAHDANYGMADVLSIFGGECAARAGLHFHGQGSILAELIDPETGASAPIEPGAMGELVYTHLDREAQPVLRYRSHDAVEIVGTGPCVCGRTSFRFQVLGRSDEMLHVRGVNVFPTAIAAVLAELAPAVSGEFQIVLDHAPPYDFLPLRVESAAEVPAGALPALAEQIASTLRQRLFFRAAIELVPVGTLPRSQGKTARIVRSY